MHFITRARLHCPQSFLGKNILEWVAFLICLFNPVFQIYFDDVFHLGFLHILLKNG